MENEFQKLNAWLKGDGRICAEMIVRFVGWTLLVVVLLLGVLVAAILSYEDKGR